MDSSRIRFLLRALRPHGADDADPTFREALEKSRIDPEVGAWFVRERAVDQALAQKLREVRPPPELRAQILQGLALSARPSQRHPFRLVAAVLAAAASLALLVYTLLPAGHGATASFDLIVTAAVRETAQPPDLGFTSDSQGAIATWLKDHHAPLPGALPGRLPDQTPLGGGVTDWQGVRCSLVSFTVPEFRATPQTGQAPNEVVHLYTVPRHSCSSQGVGRSPTIVSRDGATVATWRDATNYYVLVAHAPPASVQALLGPTAEVAWIERPGLLVL